jgi:hypothetical protein
VLSKKRLKFLAHGHIAVLGVFPSEKEGLPEEGVQNINDKTQSEQQSEFGYCPKKGN